MPTAKEVLRDAERTLKASRAVEHPHAGKERIDAEQILEHVLGREPDPDETLDPSAARRFGRLLARRAAGEPPAYITGREEFHGLWLDVGKGAFIPRQSSEWMADQAIRRLRARSRPVYVDLATGVGPVALAVASALPRARVYGADLFARPVVLARRNAERLRLRNAHFVRGDLFAPLPRALRGTVDVITVHPPYIGTRELRTMPHEILAFEPRGSLTDGSPQGMSLLSRVVAEAPAWLRPGGWLLVEVSPDRSKQVAGVIRRGGFRDVRSTKGPVPVSRVLTGRI